jgi:hypothetical protein
MGSSEVGYGSIPANSTLSTRYRLLDVHGIGRSCGRQRLHECLDGDPKSASKFHRVNELDRVSGSLPSLLDIALRELTTPQSTVRL